MRLILAASTLFCVFNSWGAVISPALLKTINENSNSNIIIYMEKAPHLVEARSIVDRNSRVTFVVEQLLEVSKRSQKPVLSFLQGLGFKARSFFSSNAIAVSAVPAQVVRQLSRFPGVRHVGLDVASELNFPFPDIPLPDIPDNKEKDVGVASHLERIKATKVWDEIGVTGEGIVVANQDTGVFWEHTALKKQYRGFDKGAIDHDYNWHDGIVDDPCSSQGAEPCDDKDHGTHTMGTMVGDDGQGNQVGVAPGAEWISCRNMKDGVGTISSYMECFDFFLAPFPIGGSAEKDGRPELAPHIVNNSWSCPSHEGCVGDEFYDVVQAYKAAGIMLVAAAGNNGPNCGSVSNQPGIYAGDLLTVGAWNRILNEIAFFSGRGPSSLNNALAPNVIAPGAFVISSLASGAKHYEDKAGTSMAAPQVAGVVALLWSHRPELIGQIDVTIDIIQSSATPITGGETCGSLSSSQVPNAAHGYGMLDAYKALTIQ